MERSSKIWYLLPIFFGFFGGLLAYFVLKDDDKKTAKNALIIGIIVLALQTLAAFALAGLGLFYLSFSSDNDIFSLGQDSNGDNSQDYTKECDQAYITMTISPFMTINNSLERELNYTIYGVFHDNGYNITIAENMYKYDDFSLVRRAGPFEDAEGKKYYSITYSKYLDSSDFDGGYYIYIVTIRDNIAHCITNSSLMFRI